MLSVVSNLQGRAHERVVDVEHFSAGRHASESLMNMFKPPTDTEHVDDTLRGRNAGLKRKTSTAAGRT